MSTGFFDIKNPESKLWEKPSADFQISPRQILAQFSLLKKSKSRDRNLTKRIFTLTKNTLCYKKDQNKPKFSGCLSLPLMRVYYEFDLPELEGHHSIKLVRDGMYIELFTKNELDLNRLLQFLTPLTIQTNFHKKYRPLKLINFGSSAKVFLVERKTDKKKFAVKSFFKSNLKKKKFGKEQLENEISNLKKLSELKGFVKFIETHETENSIYLVQEFLKEGELFSTKRYKEKMWPIKSSLKIFCQILEIVKKLHSQNLMHRDLNPETILVTSREANGLPKSIKLINFGLLVEETQKDFFEYRCGTRGYMAPEIINSVARARKKYSKKCDVYSLGLVLFVMLVGDHPFYKKKQDVSVLNQKGLIEFEKYERFERLSLPIQSLLEKMLRTDPKDRIDITTAYDNLRKIIGANGSFTRLELDKDDSDFDELPLKGGSELRVCYKMEVQREFRVNTLSNKNKKSDDDFKDFERKFSGDSFKKDWNNSPDSVMTIQKELLGRDACQNESLSDSEKLPEFGKKSRNKSHFNKVKLNRLMSENSESSENSIEA